MNKETTKTSCSEVSCYLYTWYFELGMDIKKLTIGFFFFFFLLSCFVGSITKNLWFMTYSIIRDRWSPHKKKMMKVTFGTKFLICSKCKLQVFKRKMNKSLSQWGGCHVENIEVVTDQFCDTFMLVGYLYSMCKQWHRLWWSI